MATTEGGNYIVDLYFSGEGCEENLMNTLLLLSRVFPHTLEPLGSVDNIAADLDKMPGVIGRELSLTSSHFPHST